MNGYYKKQAIQLNIEARKTITLDIAELNKYKNECELGMKVKQLINTKIAELDTQLEHYKTETK